MGLTSGIPSQERKFSVTEIRNYILSQDSMGDVLYNLNESNIDRANEDYREDEDYREQNDDFYHQEIGGEG